MYKILCVGTHAIHCVVFQAHYYFYFHLQTTLRLFVLLCLVCPAAYGIMNSQPILLQRLDKNNNKPRADCFQDKNADMLPSSQEPSDGRLANFVRPWVSLLRTTKDETAYCCTPIINGKKEIWGPWSATHGRVGLVTLKTPRASPWCKRASAKPMGIPVWLSAVATSAGQCWAWWL